MRTFLLSIVLFCAIPCFSQTGIIRGTLSKFNSQGDPVITLLKSKDSSIVKLAIADSSGLFEFDRLVFGEYLVTISHVGYQKYISNTINLSESNPIQILPSIELNRLAGELDQVTVVGKKPFVQKKIDRVVINPDALISNAGVTALEVLEKSPGVLVDVNGVISLKGKTGVVVFIDDKPSYLAAADLANYLRSIPSGNIESIELMTNPPAKYDAAGNAGVINIRLKKTLSKGFNGGINLGYGQGTYLRTNNSFTFNYRINKFNFFSNLSWNQNNSYQDLTINRYYYDNSGKLNSSFSQNSYIKREQGSKTARIGADFYASSQTIFGVVFSGFINPSIGTVTNNASIADANNAVTSLVKANSVADRVWKNGNANVNFTQKFGKKGGELSINADYVQYNSTMDQSLINRAYTPNNVLQSESTLLSDLPAKITVKAGKADYTLPFEKGGRLEIGIKTSFVKTNNVADFFDFVAGAPSPNYEFTNSFAYKENINAGYLNFSRDWKKISIQAGLRLENTNIRGKQYGNPTRGDSSFTRHYTNLFPTFYLSYRADTVEKHQFGLSIGKRINRPNYQDLNPFTSP